MPPLTGKRILITRTRTQASELATQLEALGATPIAIPTIEIVPPEIWAPLDEALARLDTFDWLLFTSANAVEIFHQRRNLTLTPKKIAAIGPATARAVEAIGLTVDLIPPTYIAESLAESLLPHARTPADQPSGILLIRAAEARDHLPDTLRAAGAHVTIAEAYRNQIPPDSIPALQHLFHTTKHHPHAITFTSASTVRNLVTLLEAADLTLPPDTVLASIGPITSHALRESGHHPTTEATEPTIPALIQSLLNHWTR